MKVRELYAASAVFIVLTVIKLLFPGVVADIRQCVAKLIEIDYDYRQVAIETANLFSKETVVFIKDTFNAHEYNDLNESVTNSNNISNQIDEFIQLQKAFEGYTIPECVFLNAVSIPFPYVSPLEATLSSGFGFRVHPIDGVTSFHYGTDFGVTEGHDIYAFADGLVTNVGYEPGFGNYVEISHSEGWKTLYAHCSDILVENYQQVSIGEKIAITGSSGRVTGPHLHFELTCNGQYANPEFYF